MGTVLEVRLSLPGSPYPPSSFPNKLGQLGEWDIVSYVIGNKQG